MHSIHYSGKIKTELFNDNFQNFKRYNIVSFVVSFLIGAITQPRKAVRRNENTL